MQNVLLEMRAMWKLVTLKKTSPVLSKPNEVLHTTRPTTYRLAIRTGQLPLTDIFKNMFSC